MKLFNFFVKNREKKAKRSFADFFVHASEKEMNDVIAEAAKRANEDQRSLIDAVNHLEEKTA